MNLKEAFRYQNKLQALMDEVQDILRRTENLVDVTQTVLRSKVNPEAEDEVNVAEHRNPHAAHITQVASFLMFLLNERERLSYAIRKAKQNMDIDFDGEVSLNSRRRQIAETYRFMTQVRSSEQISRGGGVGYKFNAEGNQISYRCDLKEVTTINFDRNKVHSYACSLEKKADQVSMELDKRVVNTEVDCEAVFDVNDSFSEIFQWYMEQNG